MAPFEYVNAQLVDKDGNGRGVEFVENIPYSMPYPLANMIAEGRMPKYKSDSKFGHDSAVTTSDIEVWDGSIAYPYMTTAAILYLSSDNTNDDQLYEVWGLDANWNMQTVLVTCNGFVAVALAGTWIRVYRVKNLGTTNNAGNIYIGLDSDVSGDGIPDALATDLKAQISVGKNQTLMALWSSPRNYTTFLTSFYASGASATVRTINIILWVRPFGGVFQVKKVMSIDSGTTSGLTYVFPLKVEAQSDVRITANASGAAEVSAGFDFYYFEG